MWVQRRALRSEERQSALHAVSLLIACLLTAALLPLPATPCHSCCAAAVGQGIPHDYVMKNSTKFADPMLAFSDKGGQLGESATQAHMRAAAARRPPLHVAPWFQTVLQGCTEQQASPSLRLP